MATFYKNKAPLLQVFADINLIVGFWASVVLPIVGFIGSAILVRYKGNYADCLIEKHFIKTVTAVSKETMTPEDKLKF